jgi:1-acyl-sn-glycerol-3-phosphate acyltransferase
VIRVVDRAGHAAWWSMQAIAAVPELERVPARQRTAARVQAFSRLCRAVCLRHGIHAEVRGVLPRGPAVLVANHLSWIDPLVLAALLPAAPVAKAEVAGWPLVGAVGRGHGIIFVARDRPASRVTALRRVLRTLQEGASVLSFPEGTTTRGDRVLPFCRGVFGAAAVAGVPVVPIALRYRSADACWTDAATFLPHYLRIAGGPGVGAVVRVGTPLWARGHRADDLAAAAHEIITRLLHEPQE